MKTSTLLTACAVVTLAACTPADSGADAEGAAGGEMSPMDSALSAAPASVTDNATIMDSEGNVLREGTNGFTCHPETPSMGAACNDASWERLIAAMMAKEPFEASGIGVSYMLAGEGDAPGVSNIDPYATEPTEDNQWTKDGPHMMLIMPDAAMLDGLSTDPNDPVYVMWKGTPYEHVMVAIAADD